MFLYMQSRCSDDLLNQDRKSESHKSKQVYENT